MAPDDARSEALQPLLDVVVAFLADDGWDYEVDPEESRVLITPSGEHASWQALLWTDEEAGQLGVVSLLPVTVDATRRPEVGELLHRINRDLFLGCFEFDVDDGSVAFRTALDVDGVALAPELVRNLLYGNLTATDHFVPALVGVLEGEAPRDALAQLAPGAS